MPSSSKKQHNLMEAVAHNRAFAKRVGIPQSVGRDFVQADKGRKFAKGGEMAEGKKMVKKEVAFMKKAGAPKSMLKHEMAEMKGMKKGGAVGKSKTQLNKDRYDVGVAAMYKGGGYVRAADGVARKGLTKGKMLRKGGMC
ncbi:MAG: hypothetical protein EBS78_11505 [Altererythrobacter sp.]|jgi:hypothetical protein|nr:hypothetical protein [Altererythrobacter sp.]